jgi:hypothetical protein
MIDARIDLIFTMSDSTHPLGTLARGGSGKHFSTDEIHAEG